MKRFRGNIIRSSHLTFLCLLITAFAVANQTTLAVLDFENHSFFNKETYQPLAKGLAEMLITELDQLQSVRMVERRDLARIIDEIKLAQSGLSDEGSMQIGKMSGAQNLVFGGFMVSPGDKIRIDMRVVEVETGLTQKAAEVTGNTKDILKLIKQLSNKIVKDLDITLTKDESRLLSQSPKIKVEAVMIFSEGLMLEDQDQLKEAYLKYKKALELEPEFMQARESINRLKRIVSERQKQSQTTGTKSD